MFPELRAWDARRLGSRLEVLFFLFQGERDVVTLTGLATEYFDEVQAPTKGLALIGDAGHFAAFTQPDRFLAELLTQVRPWQPRRVSRPAARRDCDDPTHGGRRTGSRAQLNRPRCRHRNASHRLLNGSGTEPRGSR
jgi:hypothetical protein